MSLISKPFDDSAVELVDNIARYGVALSQRIQHLRWTNQLPGYEGRSPHSTGIAMALCDAITEIAQTTGDNLYRHECARAAATMFLDSELSATHPSPPQKPINEPTENRAMVGIIKELLREPQIIPEGEPVTTQTVLLAMVWSALAFCAEVQPVNEARAAVRDRLLLL